MQKQLNKNGITDRLGNLAFNAILNYAFDYVVLGEELTYSDDGDAGFLRLKSDKNNMSVVCVIMGTSTFIVSDTPMREKDIKSMCWGIDSYDLFFDSDESGKYCYLYLGKGKWSVRYTMTKKLPLTITAMK